MAEVRQVEDGLLISLTDDASFGMFAVGSAEPRPELVRVIDKIGPLMAKRPGLIIVRGHTDNRPYSSETYDNWRLSTARAQMAYYMLVRSGIDAQRIEHVEGYADRRPKLPERSGGRAEPPDRDPDPGEAPLTRPLLRAVMLMVLSFVATRASAEPTAHRLGEPFELVRALQAVQDGIANGDTAAHASHIALIRQIGEKFLAADASVWSNPQNGQAVVIYLLSGGAPQIVRKLPRDKINVDSRLFDGALAYVEGRQDEARDLLKDVKPRTISSGMGGQVALVQGALFARPRHRSRSSVSTTRACCCRARWSKRRRCGARSCWSGRPRISTSSSS